MDRGASVINALLDLENHIKYEVQKVFPYVVITAFEIVQCAENIQVTLFWWWSEEKVRLLSGYTMNTIVLTIRSEHIKYNSVFAERKTFTEYLTDYIKLRIAQKIKEQVQNNA